MRTAVKVAFGEIEAEPIEHGGDLQAFGAAFPGAPQPWIDLSTGVNPWPYPVGKLAREIWQRLPGAADERAAREAAAAYYGVATADQVVLAPGSQALIQWLPRLRGRSRVAVLGPTYGEHVRAWRAGGHDVAELSSPDGIGADADVVVVTRPNNPDGSVASLEWLAETAARLRRRGGWLVVDEAFADAGDTKSAAAWLPEDNVVALRSFGKFFGLAGGRLGFALTRGAVADDLRAALGPWSVSGPMLAIAARALRDERWVARTRLRLGNAAARLDRMAAQAGLELVGGTALFRLYAHADALRLFRTLAEAGIYVRRFAAHRDWLRLGLPGNIAAERRVRRALSDRRP